MACLGEASTIRIMPMGDSITWGYDLSDPARYPGVTSKAGGYRIKLYNKLVEAGWNVEFCGSQTGNNPADAPAAAVRHEGYSGYTISRSFYAAYDPDCRFGGVLERIPTSFRSAKNPHVILLHLGTNVGSMGNDSVVSAGLGMNGEETLRKFGLRDMSRLLDALSEKQPGAEIIVTTLLDRDHHRDGTDTAQPGVVAFNAGLPALVRKHVAKGQKVRFFDLNPFVPLADMPDGVHPNETGYEKMAEGWFVALTNLIPDVTAFVPDDRPGIVASAQSGTSVSIWYNQDMGASAGMSGSYGLGKPSIAVNSAAADGGDARKVNVTLSAALPGDETVELFATNVSNADGTATAAKCSTALVDLSSEPQAKGTAGGGAIPVCSGDERSVLVFRRNGTFTVTSDGTVEVLLVGGGGGGGVWPPNDGNKPAAGGGGGGVVYKKAIRVKAGTYDVSVGDGGAVGANGGNSSVFGLTAYGGGAGADGLLYRDGTATHPGKDGASGGGGTTECTTLADGGAAIHAADDNFGHAGGSSTHVYGGGGGGGAGAPGADNNGSSPGAGGDGIEVSLLGVGEFYGGGGAGYRTESSRVGPGGKGGGGGYDKDGEDGRGGGGCGGRKGGSGLVAVAFGATPLDEAPADSDDFAVTGGDEVVPYADGTARIFRKDGKLTVTGSGYLDILAVGGGGGGGLPGVGNGCGGGGGGGVLHVLSYPVTAGEYDVTIGAGGDVGANGGSTTVLGLTAYGGGAGAAAGGHPGQDGASGGGGAVKAGGYDAMPGGAAVYAPFGNLGNRGGTSSDNQYGSAGGGGAGAPGADNDGSAPGAGGDGYLCTILGTNGWYAGGGAGARCDFFKQTTGGKGGGGSGLTKGTTNVSPYGTPGVDGLGGGGAGSAKGGSGTVIVRYRKLEYAAEFEGGVGGTMKRCRGYRIHTFTENGTFAMPCNGLVEMLLVGGGGGGGVNNSGNSLQGGAGGGAGGFVFTNAILTAGTYDVTVGIGGAVAANGGNSSIGAFTAFGGGAGGSAGGQTGKDGGSGGGSTHNGGAAPFPGGRATHAADGNSGHDGGVTVHIYGASGGGGAGAPGDDHGWKESIPGAGGAGRMCDITFDQVYYSGGGAGYRSDSPTDGGIGGGGSYKDGVKHPGEDGKGGGGCGGMPGGSGVVIIRYKAPTRGADLFVR